MKQHHTAKATPDTDSRIWEYHTDRVTYTHPDLGTYCAYALYAFKAGAAQTCPAAVVHDVTSIQAQAEQLADLCNRHQLSPIHLTDFIADYLAKIS